MNLPTQIAVAYALDLLCGDPCGLPHPVRWMGRAALAVEGLLRRLCPNARLAGVFAVVVIVGGTAVLAQGSLMLAGWVHPWAGDALAVLWLYTTFATRVLSAHAARVFRALQQGDLTLARERVGQIVGRDTYVLDETGVARAAVESVAENTVDGVVAPLFFAALAGPVAALAYKAISTLDSTFGYKNERYLDFGWASARLDDLAAYVPARITLPLMTIVAALHGERPLAAWKIGLRDCRKHASPNSGFSEAAMAGALGAQLGGPLSRGGRAVDLPRMGEPAEPLSPLHIRRAIWVMRLTSLLAAALFAGLRYGVEVLL